MPNSTLTKARKLKEKPKTRDIHGQAGESKRCKQIYKTWGHKGNVIFIPHPASCQSPLVPSNENFFTRVGWTKYENAEPIRRQQVDFSGEPTALLASGFAAILPFSRFVGWGK